MAKSTKKKVLNQVKKVHKLTLILVVVFALLGAAAGFGVTYFLTKDDVFKINGLTEITLNVGDAYEENGATAIAFGKDISVNVEINGEVDTTKEGKYVITYTVNNFRYKNHKLYKLVNVVAQGEVE